MRDDFILSPALVVAHYLVFNTQGGWPEDDIGNQEWTITDSKMPSNVKQWIAVEKTGVRQAARSMRGQWVEYPQVQITVRGRNDIKAQSKGKEVIDLLDALYDYSVAITDEDPAVNGTYKIQNFNREGSDLQFLMELEQEKMRVYVVSGYLTMWKE